MAERVKFYIDEHLPKAVIDGLRRRGVDVLTVPEAGMMGASVITCFITLGRSRKLGSESPCAAEFGAVSPHT